MQKFYIGDLVEHVPTGIVSIIEAAVAQGEGRDYGLQGVIVDEEILFGIEILRLIERGDIGARMDRDARYVEPSEAPRFDDHQDVSVYVDGKWHRATIVSAVGVPDMDNPDLTFWQYNVEFPDGTRSDFVERDVRAV